MSEFRVPSEVLGGEVHVDERDIGLAMYIRLVNV